ncbi:MAG: hypothetical protein P1U46_01990 [Patescibacteria group bacterium]|nr:hypothetical protein [Patescibacteria group bacterium]
MMLLISFNPQYFDDKENLNKQEKIDSIKDFFFKLAEKYDIIKSIYFSHNTNKSDTCI